MLELSHQGVVRWLVPQSIDRYDQEWLADLTDAAPTSVLLSRRLALLATLDQRRRNPLYQLTVTAYERRGVLRALHRLEDGSDGAGDFLRALAHALSDHWAGSEYFLQSRGAMASISGGLARHATELGKTVFGRDLFIELGASAQNVEWAGARGAHLASDDGEGYSSAGADGFLVALASGGDRGPLSTRSPRELLLAEELLAFDNDTNVIEFVGELGKGDLARFRRLVDELAGTQSEEALAEKVRMWNKQVRSYERRPDPLRSFNIAGIALVAASQFSPIDVIRAVVPLMAPLVRRGRRSRTRVRSR